MKFVRATALELNRFYKEAKNKARAKPDDYMYAAINKNDKTCSVLRILPYDHFLFLRSVFTLPEHRGENIARQLIEHALTEMTTHYPDTPIYTLPTPLAKSLYLRIGFHTISTDDIPNELITSYRRLKQSSKNASIMVINQCLG